MCPSQHRSIALLVLWLLLTPPSRLSSQELTATRLHLSGTAWDGTSGAILYTSDIIPLVVANASPVAQPLRFLGGANASIRSLEIGADASTWILGSVSIGALTGAAPGEMVRVGTLQATGGKGIVVDLGGTSTSSGIHVDRVGNTGQDDAGILLTSTSNGTGTGIRIGGAVTTARPTLGTGIDITGGTGIRYNALYTATGTGVDIGGTTPPLRGVDATASGMDHIGVLGRGNTIGAGVIGLAQSNAYSTIPHAQGVGVLGQGATNSNASEDTLFGVKGQTLRGGVGGTKTISIGVLGQAFSNASSNSGYGIGVFGISESAPIGQGFPIGGLFYGHSVGLALAAMGGDVFLGSHDQYRPPQLPQTVFSKQTTSLVHMFSTRTSGVPSLVNAVSIIIPTGTVQANVHAEDVPVIRIITGVNGADITGVDGGSEGRMLTLLNVGERLGIHNEGYDSTPKNRILTPDGVVMDVPANGAVTLWYDRIDERWRVLSTNY